MSAAGRRATAAPPTNPRRPPREDESASLRLARKTPGMPAVLRYVLSMFAHAHQALMMALLPGPVGVR